MTDKKRRLRAVRGKTPEERQALRRQNTVNRRGTFYRTKIASAPPGSFERLRQVLDYTKAVAEDLSPGDREELCAYIARLADERNKP